MQSNQQVVAAGILGASLAVIMIFVLVLVVLLVIARWKVFTKAGEAGWKSIVPVYSDFVQWKIGWRNTGMFWVALALEVVGYVVVSLSGAVAYDANGMLVATGNGGFLAIIGLIVMLVGGVIDLVSVYKLFLSFGKGVGWFVANLLFPNVMLLVLGFGSSQYYGPQD